MLKKLSLLSLALVLSFGLVAFVGCQESMPQEEIDQIFAGAANASYDTVSFAMDMPVTMEMTGGSDEGTMNMDMSVTGSIDNINQTMRMTMTMAIDIPGLGSESIDVRAYVVEGWMYTGMDMLVGEYWTKTALTEDMWQQQDQAGQYVELLATAIEVDYKGNELVNGVECYVFEIEPNTALLGEMLAQETSGLGMLGLGDFDLADIYEELKIKEWVAKDGYRLQRVTIEMVMEMSPEEFGIPGGDFDKVTVDASIIIRFYDYNQPFTVVLPPEALEAEEVPISY